MRSPYLIAGVGIVALIVIGIIVVRDRWPVAPSGVVSTIGPNGTQTAPTVYAPLSGSSAPTTPTSTPTNDNPATFVFNPSITTAQPSDAAVDADSPASSTQPTPPSVPIITIPPDTYDYSIFTTATPSGTARTPAQEALHTYGNTVGAFVQSYEAKYADAGAPITDYFAARGNTARSLALRTLGNDIADIGRQMQGMSSVPPEAVSAHAALATSYIKVGEGLAAMTQSPQSGDGLISAIDGYNALVDEHIRAYVGLIRVFSSASVTFTGDDPGKAFSAPSGL